MSKTELKAGSSLLSKDAILQADDRPVRQVMVPEWGGTVQVRALSGADRDAWEQSRSEPIFDKKGRFERMERRGNVRASLVARCLVDDKGELLFGEKDVEALGRKSGRALDRVYEVAAELSGIQDEDLEEAKGNSDGGPSAASTS